MCKEMSAYVRDKKYSDFINIVGITPIVAPKSIIKEGLWKEEKRCEIKYGFVSVSLHVEYEEFINGDIAKKKQLIIQNILASVKAIHKRAKIDFGEFNKDIVNYCKHANITL